MSSRKRGERGEEEEEVEVEEENGIFSISAQRAEEVAEMLSRFKTVKKKILPTEDEKEGRLPTLVEISVLEQLSGKTKGTLTPEELLFILLKHYNVGQLKKLLKSDDGMDEQTEEAFGRKIGRMSQHRLAVLAVNCIFKRDVVGVDPKDFEKDKDEEQTPVKKRREDEEDMEETPQKEPTVEDLLKKLKEEQMKSQMLEELLDGQRDKGGPTAEAVLAPLYRKICNLSLYNFRENL